MNALVKKATHFIAWSFFPGQDEKLLHLSKNKKNWQYQVILILDANNSIIYRTDDQIQFNYIHFYMQMFFVEVKKLHE